MTTRFESVLAGFLVTATLGYCALSGYAPRPALPDPALTPGAVATTDKATICFYDGRPGSAYSRAHRVWQDKADTLRKYGIPLSEARSYEDDDLIPVCDGGDNASPLNHWAQPLTEARAKDRLEAKICRAVCAGLVSVEEGQRYFTSNAWVNDLTEESER